ncbi:hypothetical protein [Thiohalobacter sp.]|uniref:hypothetical protein n=1 Tax=Thiohalobacter sp. TaxID=2025948 RepID=UPI002638457E|nr:hypothetical protein [Thiohalobacter sp.]
MKKLAVISLCSLAAATAPLTAPAETLTGTLLAQGSGIARLTGSGATRIEGKGVLVIHDAGADARVEVTGQGRRVELPNGAVAYFGFDGQARISGPTWRVALTGADIRLAARGRGQVHLDGCGHVVVHDILTPWGEATTALKLEGDPLAEQAD